MDIQLQQEMQRALSDALCLAADESSDGDLLESVQRIFDRSDCKLSVLKSLSLAVESLKDVSFEAPSAIARVIGFLHISDDSLQQERIHILSVLLHSEQHAVRHDAVQQLDRLNAISAKNAIQSACNKERHLGTRLQMEFVLKRWTI